MRSRRPPEPDWGSRYSKPADKILRKSTAPTDSPRLGALLKECPGRWSERSESELWRKFRCCWWRTFANDIAQEVIDLLVLKVSVWPLALALFDGHGNLRIPRLQRSGWNLETRNDYLMPTNISFEAVDFQSAHSGSQPSLLR